MHMCVVTINDKLLRKLIDYCDWNIFCFNKYYVISIYNNYCTIYVIVIKNHISNSMREYYYSCIFKSSIALKKYDVINKSVLSKMLSV